MSLKKSSEKSSPSSSIKVVAVSILYKRLNAPNSIIMVAINTIIFKLEATYETHPPHLIKSIILPQKRTIKSKDKPIRTHWVYLILILTCFLARMNRTTNLIEMATQLNNPIMNRNGENGPNPSENTSVISTDSNESNSATNIHLMLICFFHYVFLGLFCTLRSCILIKESKSMSY